MIAHVGRVLAGYKKPTRVFQQVIVDGIATGEFHETDVSVARLAFIGMHSYTSVWLDPAGPMDARQLSAFFCNVFVEGLGTTGATHDVAKVEDEMDQHREELLTLLAVASERHGLRLGPRPSRSARRKRDQRQSNDAKPRIGDKRHLVGRVDPRFPSVLPGFRGRNPGTALSDIYT